MGKAGDGSNAEALGQAGQYASATPAPSGTPAPRVVTIQAGGLYNFRPPILNDPNQRCCVLAVMNDSSVSATVSKNAELTIAIPSGLAVLLETAGRNCVLGGGPNIITCSDVNQESSSLAFTAISAGGLPPSVAQILYPAGWNLLSLPSSFLLKGIVDPDSFWRAGSDAHGPPLEFNGANMQFEAGYGLWVYFDKPVTVTLPDTPPVLLRGYQAPLGGWIAIGNPSSRPAKIEGGPGVYVQDGAGGYRLTSVLQPGQAGWLYGDGSPGVTIDSTTK